MRAARSARRSILVVVAVLMLLMQGALHAQVLLPLWKKNFSVNNTNVASGLSPDQLLVALAGFRELVAGILWVRGDQFFDEGNYDAILPIVRLVTWLDPKQIDVFTTGMWHIAYNFTDEQQRSDRRYIPSALALGKEGIRNNPGTYEMYFEVGWLWYHKIDDEYDKAVSYWEQAIKYPDMLPARKNLLPAAYQRAGQMPKALDVYSRLLVDAERRFAAEPSYGNRTNRDTVEGNLDTMLVRMSSRGEFAREQKRFDPARGYDTEPPFDTGLSARVTVVNARFLRVEGTWNVLPVGTRIRFILRDKNYPRAVPAGMDWDFSNDVSLDPPKDLTFLQDQLYVRNRRFQRDVDMTKDVTMYPIESDSYVLEFYYSPRSAPPHIQDKFSWNGEGMTDKNFLNETIRPGYRTVYATLELTKDQLLRRNEWAERVPIVQTKNFKPGLSYQDLQDMIIVPNLRSPAK